nr:uncharacterized protein LOC106681104 isoform X2 [Halyomorpha halys]
MMPGNKLFLSALFLLSLFLGCFAKEDGRYLVYTSGGGVFKFIVGFAVPVPVPMSLIFAHNFQFQYQAIDNATEWTYLMQQGILRSLSLNRLQLFSHLHALSSRPDMNENSTYMEAWKSGQSEAGCEHYDCPFGQGLLDYVSIIY